jgi:hypothetical protein
MVQWQFLKKPFQKTTEIYAYVSTKGIRDIVSPIEKLKIEV